jgi:hypothetical protein
VIPVLFLRHRCQQQHQQITLQITKLMLITIQHDGHTANNHNPTVVHKLLMNDVPLLTHLSLPLINIIISYYPTPVSALITAIALPLVKLLSHSKPKVRTQALAVIGSICANGDESSTDVILAGVLAPFTYWLRHDREEEAL